jgi:hypothetical protein
MGVGYSLVNYTQREKMYYRNIPASTAWELTGNPVAASMTTYYLLKHRGDLIAFISDSEGEWPFPGGSRKDLKDYREVTDEVVQALIEAQVLVDEGREIFDEDDPDVYVRRLRNIFLDDKGPTPLPPF